MMKRMGSTVLLDRPVFFRSWASAGGEKEQDGPLGAAFDLPLKEDRFGEESFEKAESKMQKEALACALNKAALAPAALDVILAGDLLNQCAGSTFAMRETGRPFLGLYGACSTSAEALGLAALLIAGGAASLAAAVTSSHFAAAERQFRTPLEYGGQRTPSAQWTVTASGAFVLGANEQTVAPCIRRVRFGRIVDLGIKDAANMGAAMAPAAADTLLSYFAETGIAPEEYDVIATGDLGKIGHDLLTDLLEKEGLHLSSLTDCGLLIYDRKRQDVHAGGSGCGCSASVLAAYFLPRLAAGEIRRMLFLATGAYMSPTTSQQGESIPGICHLVEITGGEPCKF